MKNCQFCGKPVGSEFIVLLQGRYSDNGIISVYDDYGVACSDCIDSGIKATIEIGSLKLRFE